MLHDVRQKGLAARVGPWLWLSPLLFMALTGSYLIARYNGQWAEADSATFTKIIRAFTEDGGLAPEFGPVYPNGYLFQAISSFILGLTGIDVVTLQQVLYPLLSLLIVLPAWVLYRELTESALGATLATVLLCSQPELLFMILRSSHEKFTRILMLLCLYILVRSFRHRDQPWQLAAHVGLFYLLFFSLAGSNNLIAHSFIFAIVIAILLGRLLERRTTNELDRDTGVFSRFLYIVLIALAMVYLFIFYVYPPAQHDLLVLESVTDRIIALLVDMRITGGSGATNAYLQVQNGWVSLPVYLLVSIANWIILGISFAIVCYQGARWLGWGDAPKTLQARLLWLFYVAFSVQGVLSILSDASGALGSNLQHRLFPSFSIMAVAVVGGALSRWRPRRYTGPVRFAVAASISVIAILSILKATNEPLVSNKWTFYRPVEMAALVWTDAHLAGSPVWTEFDERLVVAYDMAKGDSDHGNLFQGYGARTTTRTRVVTEVARLRADRLDLTLPLPPDAFRVYDNGAAEVYHLRPETPYQP